VGREEERILNAYLVASARIGDRRALASLVGRWNGKLLAHAARLLRDREGARDAVQEGWAEMLRGLHRLRDDAAFPAWAYRIVSRRCARQVARRRGEERIRSEFAAELPDEDLGSAPDGVLALRRAIKELSSDQQAAIALYYLEDMSVAEVAVALDVAAGTVKTRLMHARRKLRIALQGDS
jgi:RNA polymerase sigma-70 factor (ECF subfamily)